MKKLYNQVKRHQWRECEYSMPVIARFGTGGGNTPVILETLVFDTTQVTSALNWSVPKWGSNCHPLAATAHPPTAVIKMENGMKAVSDGNGQLHNMNMTKGGDAMTSVVRRLTPKECERLQGFPDDWSRYGINEKGEVYELSDAARYRLQGNSLARPFWTVLMRRIGAQYERTPTLGSLFDGQGGFPLCAAEAGIKPLWASEIEKHAVAVTKYHFKEKNENG